MTTRTLEGRGVPLLKHSDGSLYSAIRFEKTKHAVLTTIALQKRRVSRILMGWGGVCLGTRVRV